MESRHLVTVTEAEVAESERYPPVVALTYRVDEGPAAGTILRDALPVTDKGIWRVVALFRALGFKVEKQNMSIPLSTLTGRQMIVALEDGEVRGHFRHYAALP